MLNQTGTRVVDFLQSVSIAFGQEVSDLCAARIEEIPVGQAFNPHIVLDGVRDEYDAKTLGQMERLSHVPFYSRLDLK
jgi:hypothetical protein